ncbi:arsenate reductase ArsC [Nitrosophilus alvini]|uniref:arsenate reductase ArsC n=1 Tax=Nitrosophilus alvini TaxID=2714855 RepID=UPI00190A3B9D|nr:arsenate reductase ArsC [Nitrosophilus alvini]
MKNVLILCTGNSCRSIMAEALINAKLKGCVKAYSSGVNPSGKVNPNAKKLLQKKGIWEDEYRSKPIEEIEEIPFDLVITVCDNAKETCPVFSRNAKTIHIGFEDPDGKEIAAFEETLNDIEKRLLPVIEKELCN